uniref:Protein krueppel n=1 Tax=Anopheles farauti TaxID=69004 RepID=A0A182QYQ3_9DIPT
MASSEVEHLIFGEICRCCMTSKPRMKPLFDTNLFAMLNTITNLNVQQNDGLPSQLCVPCVLQIRRSHFFKIQCEMTDKTLRSYAVGTKGDSIYGNDDKQPAPRTIKIEPDDSSALHHDRAPRGDETDAVAKRYCCHKCPKEFLAQKNLKRHLRIHFPHKPHACTECDMSFAENSNLKKHMLKHTGELRNSDDKRHLCSECGKSFKYGTSLSRHKRMHARRNLFACPVCDKAYVEQSSLDVHMRSHTNERPFACTTCDKSFSQRVNLERHERTHTGEKPYRCDMCGKCFSQKSYLGVHKRIHSNEKPFICGACSKCFISRNALHKHQLRPCAVTPYRCNGCKKTFRFKKALRLHRRTHHQDGNMDMEAHMIAHRRNVDDSDYLNRIKMRREMLTENRLNESINGEYDDGSMDDALQDREPNGDDEDLADEEHDAAEDEFDEDEELEEEEDEDEEIEIEESVSFLEEYDDMPEETGSVTHGDEEVHAVVYENGELVEQEAYGDLIDDDYADGDITRERLLEIRIMNPDEEYFNNEH